MATVDDIASWSRMAPHLAVLFAKVQEERRSRELAEAAAEWLAAWPGGDLDAKDEAGWSALQRAAAAGQAVAVAELLRRPSVEVNGVEPTKGQPALVLASRLGHAAVVRGCCSHARPSRSTTRCEATTRRCTSPRRRATRRW